MKQQILDFKLSLCSVCCMFLLGNSPESELDAGELQQPANCYRRSGQVVLTQLYNPSQEFKHLF